MIANHVECHPLAYDTGKAFDIVRTSLTTSFAAGVDTSVIALWLGHEQVQTTQIYLHGDLTMKEAAIAKVAPASTPAGRYRPPDKLLAFLQGL